jgi:hypothetical protein
VGVCTIGQCVRDPLGLNPTKLQQLCRTDDSAVVMCICINRLGFCSKNPKSCFSKGDSFYISTVCKTFLNSKEDGKSSGTGWAVMKGTVFEFLATYICFGRRTSFAYY